MQTPGKGEVLQHPTPGHPSLSEPRRRSCLQSWDRAAHSPHPDLLPLPSLSSSRELPVPRRAREPPGLRGRSAGVAAVPPPRRANRSSAIIGTGGCERGRCRPCPAAQGQKLRCVVTAAAPKKTPAPGVPDVVTKGCRHPTPSQQM